MLLKIIIFSEFPNLSNSDFFPQSNIKNFIYSFMNIKSELTSQGGYDYETHVKKHALAKDLL